MSSEEKVITALIQTGLTTTEAEEIAQNLTDDEAQQLIEEGEITSDKKEKKTDGFINALTLAGFSLPFATGVASALSDDEEVVRLLLAGQTPLRFMTQQDSKVDDKICLPKQGEIWAKEDSRRPRIPTSLHPNCLLPDTLIEFTDGIFGGLRTWYNGPVIEIFTANSGSLTVTPNHLLLTPQGFVAADFLRKGDKIIHSTYPKRPSFSIYPNNNRKPTTIEQVFNSLVESFSMNTTSVPISSEYLHGDARFSHGNIDIIRSNSFLSSTQNPSRFKHFFTNLFNRCNSYLSFFSSSRRFAFCLKSMMTSSNRRLSGTRKTSSFFRGRLRHTQIHRSTSSSGSNSICFEMFDDISSTTLENLRKCLYRFSSIVQLDEVININVKPYSGFVYDIQTESTLYSGNSIILSNCRCFWQDPITERNLGQF